MTSGNTYPKMKHCFGVMLFLIAIAACVTPFAVRSSSASLSSPRVARKARLAHASAPQPLASPTPPPALTFAPDCTTPKTDFNLGDVVCAKVSGVPVTPFDWHVFWGDTIGFIRKTDVAVSNDGTTYTFTLPSSATSIVDGQTIDNRG